MESYQTSRTKESQRFRPDVAKAIDFYITRAAGLSYKGKLTYYSEAKRHLSRLCGWDAPDGWRDEALYSRAMGRFIKGVGL